MLLLLQCPEKRLLLCGDNYYHAFPNIYAIRGVSSRNGYAWYKSIESFMKHTIEYDINYLIPSHCEYVIGQSNIYNRFDQYRDGVAFVFDQTVRYLNQGYDTEEIVNIIENNLPSQLFGDKNSHLSQFYGTIEWAIKGVATKILGWFHTGKPIDLFPASKHVRGDGIIKLLSFVSNHNHNNNNNNRSLEMQIIDYCNVTIDGVHSRQHNNEKIQKIDDENRWILELITWVRQSLINKNKLNKEAKKEISDIRHKIFRHMASYQTSMPARNYLLSYLFEEKYDLEVKPGDAKQWYKDIILDWFIFGMAFYVDPLLCNKYFSKKNNGKDKNIGLIELTDSNKTFRLILKKVGVLQIELIDKKCVKYNNYNGNNDIDWVIKDSTQKFKQFLLRAVELGSKRRVTIGKGNNDRGHEIPRIRTSIGVLIALFRVMINMKAKSIIKGRDKAKEFFDCLEAKLISKL